MRSESPVAFVASAAPGGAHGVTRPAIQDEFAFLAFDSDTRVIADLGAQPRERIEQRRLAAIGIAGQGDVGGLRRRVAAGALSLGLSNPDLVHFVLVDDRAVCADGDWLGVDHRAGGLPDPVAGRARLPDHLHLVHGRQLPRPPGAARQSSALTAAELHVAPCAQGDGRKREVNCHGNEPERPQEGAGHAAAARPALRPPRPGGLRAGVGQRRQ